MSERLLVATRKGLFDFKRSRNGWSAGAPAFLGSPVSMSLRDPRDGAIYAALDLGHFGVKLHRSEDDGANWTEIAAPSYAGIEPAEGEAPSLKLIWSLEIGGEDGELWAGTLPGGLFRSTDRGDSWALNRPLWDQPSRAKWFGGGYDTPGIHSICVDPRDPKVIDVAVSCGGVWRTTDGGVTWALASGGMWAAYMPPEAKDDPAIQDPHRMVRCAADPDTLWAQHHNGVFRTTQGVGRWHDVVLPGSSFGFAVAVHPKRPGTAWFAPAVKDEYRYPVDGKFVVAKTEDGGASFRLIDNGLPAETSYDLVYRHGLDIDGSGERLAMGSTTGNLWISEDGGEGWRQVSGHLPPIYGLRFV
ncbi:MAG TPA: hypothetical protein VFN88_01460 [Caulobacteraceae bacterium]|nr:hypothetical protein [Caulobacteraceae bacterium]